ncbi:LysR substrate-binding domain-containing protein [Lysobacter capsici]|uniref:LysR substrate-binding domain-containing protein n=2 Tax=Lysobacter capsici TaxID=435897 RepID=UPI00398D24C2
MVDTPRMPSLIAIRAFEAAARLGSFAQAAQELDTSAASVSYHVRRLEDQVGVRLFVRHPQRVTLTSPGEVMAAEATKAFAALRASFIRAVETDRSQLSLTALPSFGTSWLTPRLGRFRARHPDISLELDLSAEAQDLSAGKFDAAIRNGHGQWAGLHTTELFPSVFMPLCAPALRAAAAAIADPREPLRVPLLGRSDWWQLWYQARGFADVDLHGRFGTHLSAEYLDIAAAIAGHGIAIGSPILFHHALQSGELVPAHDFVARDGRAFWFTCPAGRQHSAKIVKFREWVGDEASAARHAARHFLAPLHR